MELKNLREGISKFTANEREYFVEPHLSAERYMKLQEFQMELGHGINLKKVIEQLQELKSMMNKAEFVKSAVLIHNLESGLISVNNKEQLPVLKLCTLFINTKDEDRRKFDEKEMERKIEDWKEEGISIDSFFLLANGICHGLLKNSSDSFLKSSKKKEQKEN